MTVQTGHDNKWAGTQNVVNLEISGTEGTSRRLYITDPLNKGQVQNFTFTNVKNLGVVKVLRVELGAGSDRWYWESIVLRNSEQHQYTFVYNKWLSNSGKKSKPKFVALGYRAGNVYVLCR